MHRHSIARTLKTSLKKVSIQLAGYFLMGNFYSLCDLDWFLYYQKRSSNTFKYMKHKPNIQNINTKPFHSYTENISDIKIHD